MFQSCVASGKIKDNQITTKVVHLSKLHFATNIKTLFTPEHPITSTCELLHEFQIIIYVTKTFVTLGLKAFSKNKTLEVLGKKANLRQKLNKTILFDHV